MNTERCIVHPAMDIQTFYAQQTADQRAAFADAIGTSLQYYRNVASGFRQAGSTLALAIERESRGKVTVRELSPELAQALSESGYRKRSQRAA
jgi:DNA-binding transcriptional regulator YdaS (Cro superfamily)